MVKIINVLLICVLSLLFLSCTENPLTSVPDKTTQPNSSEGAITFISLPMTSTSLEKSTQFSDAEWITTKRGGTLEVNFSYKGTNGKVSVDETLTIPRGALQTDQVLTMRVDQQTLSGIVGVNMAFGPEGTMFLTPALLDIDASGLDLSSVPPNANVQLYYFDLTTNNYVVMVAKKVTCNIKNGTIKCQDGELPHFSRYAFGYVR